MDSSQSLDAQPAVFLNGSINRDMRTGVWTFFATQVAPVICVFDILHLLDYGVYYCFLRAFYPYTDSIISLISKWLLQALAR